MKKNILSKVNILKNKIAKRSPEILIVAGTIGIIGSTVAACRATTKLSSILDKSKEEIDLIHKYAENPDLLPNGSEEYTLKDSQKDLTKVYMRTGVDVIKLYLPSVILGITSLTCVLTSNNILRKRNAALAAAYATVDRSFKEYRNRVIERFGENTDRELKFNIKAKEIEETITDEKGKEKKVKKTVDVIDPTVYSGYARVFDSKNDYWEETPEYNLMFLKSRESIANNKLMADGRLFLNEVYEMLGFPKTKAGQVVGWVYDPNNEDDENNDNFVSFGIFDTAKQQCNDFINGYSNTIILDFNVYGNVWELM